jgi:hypothetical protein
MSGGMHSSVLTMRRVTVGDVVVGYVDAPNVRVNRLARVAVVHNALNTHSTITETRLGVDTVAAFALCSVSDTRTQMDNDLLAPAQPFL